MSDVGLRELRRDAADLVRRVNAGEEITIVVDGRPRARLVRANSRQWRSYSEIADLYEGPPGAGWISDLDRVDGALRDSWS